MRFACAAVLLALSSLSTVACTPPSAPALDPALERARLLDTERAFSNDSVRRGADQAFDAFLADDAVELPGGGAPPLHGRPAIVASLHSTPGDARFTLKWAPEDAAVSKSGDIGYTWGSYELTSAVKEGAPPPTVTRGRYLTIWRKEVGGRWRAIVDIGNK